MTLILGWRNNAPIGTVTVSAFATGLGPEQLLNDQGGASTAWQTPSGITSATLLIDCPAALKWRLFGLMRTNLSPLATVTFAVKLGDVVVYMGASAAVAPGYGQAIHAAPTELTGNQMQVAINDPGNEDGFLNVPLIYAGPGFQPTRNYGYASAVLRDDGSTITRTRSGAEYVRNDWQRRGFDLSLGALAPAEVTQIVALDTYARRGGNVFFVPNPLSTSVNQEAVFGRLQASAGIGWANNSNRTRSWRATIMERL